MSPAEQVSDSSRLRNLAIRILVFAVTAFVLARLCGAALKLDGSLKTPPGFFRGMLHGAIMPMAWPSLLTGHDQEIYAQKNTGRVYKLGYCFGVNLSGLFFFGWGFIGLSSLRKRIGSSGKDRSKSGKH